MLVEDKWKATRGLLRLAIPITCVQMCQLLLLPVSLIFCGHLRNTTKVDGAALALSVISCSVIAIGQGLSTACETFFSQTISSNNKMLVGVYIQKALLLFTLFIMPFYVFHFTLEITMTWVGIDHEVARLAEEYLRIFTPATLSYVVYIILCKYLYSMDIVLPNIVIVIFTNGVNALLHYVLIYRLDYGIRGSAIALTTAYLLNCILVLAYIIISGCYKDTWPGWTRDSLVDLLPMAKLALSGMLMVAMEYWAIELGLVLAGIIGKTELGAYSILLQLDGLFFQILLGINIATSLRVGQCLGNDDIRGAKTVACVAIILGLLASIPQVVIVLSIPHQLAALFTNIPEITELTGNVIPLLLLLLVVDSIANACKGILTGCGRQRLVAGVVLFSYYAVALPFGISTMFLTSLGIAGYWLGTCLSFAVLCIVFGIIIFKTNWENVRDQAMERNKSFNFPDLDVKSLLNSELKASYSSVSCEKPDIRER